jgi:hypothetical protein
MIKIRERIDTLEALNEAVEGYQHLPIDVLSQFLLDNYTVDLDLLAQFSDSAAPLRQTDKPGKQNTAKSKQSAA